MATHAESTFEKPAEPKLISDFGIIGRALHKIRTAHETSLYRSSLGRDVTDRLRTERDAIAALQDVVELMGKMEDAASEQRAISSGWNLERPESEES